jgi:phosphatidylglycerophosphate synthase
LGSELAAVVLAESPLARTRIAGLTARERAIRVARRVGASRVVVVDTAADRARVAELDASALLVIRADQLVHPPLAQPIVAAAATAIAVGPDDAYAGAFVARGAADVTAARTALAAGTADDAIAASLTAARVAHGTVARHAIATPAERRAAHRLLYTILIKPQDNAITRYVYRPVSFPLTRALAWTPISPNQISYLVAVFVAVGCYVTAHASHLAAFAGTAIILAGSYLDCCDGEIARVKLLSSRLGAWLDTIIDETSSIGYMVALGWHCHLAYGGDYFGDLGFDPWLAAIALGVVTYGATIYCVYYNIIVAVGSANSQDYARFFRVEPGGSPETRRLVPITVDPPAPADRGPVIAWIVKYGPYIVRRDFISWGATLLAAASLTQVSFVAQIGGGIASAIVCVMDHARLRALRRSVLHAGHVLESP